MLAYIVLDQLVRSPIGETLTAIREDEVSAASLGINCQIWKVFAFAVSSAVAGVAGCFYASFVGTLVPDAFFITESFTVLAMVIVGGMGTLIGPVLGAILLTVLPELLRGIGDLRLIVYGVAVTLVVLFMPGGIVQAARTDCSASAPTRSHRRSGEQDMNTATHSREHGYETTSAANAILFRAEGLQKSFGGVQAVRDISLDIPAGIVFAVIGPNGAGKSTLLNLISGLYQPDAGKMTFSGIEPGRHARATACAAWACSNVSENSAVQTSRPCSKT